MYINNLRLGGTSPALFLASQDPKLKEKICEIIPNYCNCISPFLINNTPVFLGILSLFLFLWKPEYNENIFAFFLLFYLCASKKTLIYSFN